MPGMMRRRILKGFVWFIESELDVMGDEKRCGAHQWDIAERAPQGRLFYLECAKMNKTPTI
jgi:hypothetical protein